MFKWLLQVGLLTKTNPGKNCLKKSNPILKEPVPDKA
jgi:hypothetical protein